MLDVGPIVNDFPKSTVTRRRFGASSINTYGEQVETYTDVVMSLVVHTSGRAQIERLGLDASRETISLYDRNEIRGVGTTRADQFLFQGHWYEIVSVGDYATMGGIYCAHAQRIETFTEPAP